MWDAISKFIHSSFGIWSIFGIIAILVKICEFQVKKRNTRIFIYSMACACWTFYFLLKGEIVSACANALGLVQGLVFMQKEKHSWAKSYFWLGLFLFLQVANCAINFSAWHDVFPMIGNILGAIAYFVISEKTYRFLSLLNCTFWLSNSICKVAILALVCDASSTISGLIGLARFFARKNREKKQKQIENFKNAI